jgi:hypothetical protein
MTGKKKENRVSPLSMTALKGHGLRCGTRDGSDSPLPCESIRNYCTAPTWVGQCEVKTVVRSATRVGHDDQQLTCWNVVSIEEINKLVIFVSNDAMIF